MSRNPFDIEAVIEMYTVQHLTMQQIADKVGYSKAYVQQRLKAAGIDAKQGTWIAVTCHSCGNEFKEMRFKVKRAARHFCKEECYYKARATTKYKQNRQGQRIGRQVVGQYFVLPEGAIVHHEDGDDLNNEPFNLRIFSSQSDHLKYHHGVNPVEPIWDGRIVSREVLADVA